MSDDVDFDDMFEEAIVEAVQTAIAETTSTVKNGASPTMFVKTLSTAATARWMHR